jgi:hypothetical protein
MRFSERSKLEFTKSSGKQKLMVCPTCLTGRNVSVSCYGVLCNNCKTWFTEETKANEQDLKQMLTNDFPEMTPERRAIMVKSEKDAYEWRDNVIKRKKEGTYPKLDY